MKNFFLALLGHLILFCLVVLCVTETGLPEQKIIKHLAIKAYPVMEMTGEPQEVFQQKKFKFNKIASLKPSTLIKNYPSPKPFYSRHSKPTKQAVKKSFAVDPFAQKTKRALLLLLHQKIRAKQTYPETARLLDQTGTVSLGFNLFPDGHLEKIAILKSSGFTSIDGAALSSLKSIAPIKEATLYLHTPTFFSVDIVFE